MAQFHITTPVQTNAGGYNEIIELDAADAKTLQDAGIGNIVVDKMPKPAKVSAPVATDPADPDGE